MLWMQPKFFKTQSYLNSIVNAETFCVQQVTCNWSFLGLTYQNGQKIQVYVQIYWPPMQLIRYNELAVLIAASASFAKLLYKDM